MEVCAMALLGYTSPLPFWVLLWVFSLCSPAARRSFSSHPHASGGKGPEFLGLYSWAYLKAPS